MTKIKKCHHASPRLLDRLVMWLGFNIDLHNWKLYQRQNKHIIYYCRQCECGKDQIKNAGPMGDGKWQDVETLIFRWDWEKDSFNGADICDT